MKPKKRECKDFISSLPDEILHHIVSFLPTKSAIRTSILSKRWQHIWHGTSSISVDCDRSNLIIPVNKTLHSFSAPEITSFDLSIRIIKVHESVIDSWINFAKSRKVKNLSLVIEAMYHFPDCFFDNSDVKKLNVSLRYYPLPNGRRAPSYDMVPKCAVSWSSLKELSLNTCNIPDKSLANIISGCPVLETLVLKSCRKLCRVDLSNTLNLKRLEIFFSDYYTNDLEEIVAPNVRYLKLTNYLKPCNLVDVSSLTEASFSLSDQQRVSAKLDNIQDHVLKILAQLQNVEKLTIEGIVLQILSVAKLCGVPCPQFKTKELIVETMVVQSVMPGITELLQNTPKLKKITIYTMNCKAIADTDLNRYLRMKDLNPYDCWCGFFPMVETSQMTSSYFNGNADQDPKSEHVASFMGLLLRSAKNLETMVLQLGGYLGKREYPKLLRAIPSVSRNKNGETKVIVLNSFKINP